LHRLSIVSIYCLYQVSNYCISTAFANENRGENAHQNDISTGRKSRLFFLISNYLYKLLASPIYCLYQVSNYCLSNAFVDKDRGGEDTSKRRAYYLNRIFFLSYLWLPLQITCIVYLLSLSIVSIKSIIIVYLLHLLTRIETRTHTKTTFLQTKKHAFSSLFSTVYLNHLHRLSIASIKLATIVYLIHLSRNRDENAHQIDISTDKNACIFSLILNCLHDINYAHSIVYTQSRLAQRF